MNKGLYTCSMYIQCIIVRVTHEGTCAYLSICSYDVALRRRNRGGLCRLHPITGRENLLGRIEV
jgi:hypothetical protein